MYLETLNCISVQFWKYIFKKVVNHYIWSKHLLKIKIYYYKITIKLIANKVRYRINKLEIKYKHTILVFLLKWKKKEASICVFNMKYLKMNKNKSKNLHAP